jgi:hypothetical protein
MFYSLSFIIEGAQGKGITFYVATIVISNKILRFHKLSVFLNNANVFKQ